MLEPHKFWWEFSGINHHHKENSDINEICLFHWLTRRSWSYLPAGLQEIGTNWVESLKSAANLSEK